MPAESVAWAYDGVDTVTVTITGATPSTTYAAAVSSSFDSATAVSSTVILTVDLSGEALTPGAIIEGFVVVTPQVTVDEIADTLFRYGTAGQRTVDATWNFDPGTNTLSCTFPSVLGDSYSLFSNDNANGFVSGDTDTGTGAPLTLQSVFGSPPTGDYWQANVFNNDTTEEVTIRLFVNADGGAGFPGNPTPTPLPPIAPPTQVFGGTRFYEAPPSRFFVTDRNHNLLTFLDRLALDRSVTITRAAARVQTLRVPSDNPEVNIPAPDPDSPPFVSEGTRFLFWARREGRSGSGDKPWKVRAAGLVLDLDDEADSDHATSIITAYDPWKYLYRRPVLLEDGSLPGEVGRVYAAGTTANEIIIDQLQLAEIYGGSTFTDFGNSLFYAGTLETTDPLPDDGDGLAITFASGVTLGEMLDTLVATGTCDVVFDPIYDPVNRAGLLCELSIYQKAGQWRPNAIFGWDKWPRNVVQLSRQIDGTARANRIQMYAGAGGPPVPEQDDAASIAEFGEYWALQYLPGVPSIGAAKTIAQRQLALLKDGQYTYALSPAAERSPLLFQEYREADTLPLHASRRFRDPIVGVPLRVESIPIVIGDDELERVNQMLVSFAPETGS